MKVEVIWTALPVAVSGNKLKLSVFVSHRLYGPSATTLAAGGFTDVLGWAGKNVQFKVRFGATVVPATVVSAVNAQLHAAAFPGSTPVRGMGANDAAQRFQRQANREMKSYSTATLGILLRGTYQAAATLNPSERIDAEQMVMTTLAWADPLRPRRPYSEEQLLPTQIVNLGAARVKKGDRRSFAARWAEVESAEAQELGKSMESALRNYRNAGGPPPPNTPEGWKFLAFECKQFFESMAPGKVHPKYGKVRSAINVPEPSFDYHDAQSLIANHPSLMRSLGFAFDIEVTLPANFPATGVVSVEPVYTKTPDTEDRTPKTAFRYVPGQVFLPKPKAGSEVGDGFLKVGAAPYFTAQYDIDSGILKLMDFVQTMRNALQVRQHDAPANPPKKQPLMPGTDTLDLDNSEVGRSKVTLPALRTNGLSLYRHERAQKVKSVFQKAMAMQADLVPAAKAFEYDELIRGYRVDIFDRGSWKPLMGRAGGYNLKGVAVPAAGLNGAPFDEAWMSATMTSGPSKPGDPPATGPVKVHEALWSWHGWSLAVEKPGQAMDEQGKPTKGSNKLDPNFPVAMNFSVPPGSLPTLRYGHKYKMRARAVDLAGNSAPPNSPTLGGGAFETPEASYDRFDPVLSPQLVGYKVPANADPIKDTTVGSAENQIVIRKFKGDATIKPSRREVFPPYGSVSLSETHGMFDLPNGKVDPAAYTSIIVPREGRSAPPEVTAPIDDVPYLVDPLGDGFCVQFTPLPYPNTPPSSMKFGAVKFPSQGWPKVGTCTLEVAPSAGPASPPPSMVGRKMTIGLRPGEVVKALVSSTLGDMPSLNLMGLWNWLPPATKSANQTAALMGRMWTLTPYREVTLVYAVQIPEVPAQVLFFKPYRATGNTFVRIGDNEQTAIVTHAWSTVEVEVLAEWHDDLDLMEEPKRTTLTRKVEQTAFKIGINRDEFLHRFVKLHELGDTKYHNITYTMRAWSRFRDYFPKSLNDFSLDTVADLTKTVDGRNLPGTVKGTLNFDCPSTARPDVPLVEYVIPTFGWTRPNMQNGQRSYRDGGGLRVYLRRPWFSSGNGERLAVVLPSGSMGGLTQAGMPPAAEWPYVTLFGGDPTSKSGNVHPRPMAGHFPGAQSAGKYLKLEENLALNVGSVSVPVEFDPERQLWFADIQIEPGNNAYMPFVRLALARYQEFSLPGLELSRVAVADFMQLTPDRAATVTYLSDTRFKVVVSGVGTEGAIPGRTIVGTVEVSPGRYDGKNVEDEDTGWHPVMVGGKELEHVIPLTPAPNRTIIARPPPGGIRRVPPPEEGDTDEPFDAEQGRVAVPPPNQGRIANPQLRPVQEGPGEFTLPGPRGAAKYRLVIREYEIYLSDFPEPVIEPPANVSTAPPPTRGRLVYADVIPLV